MSPQVVGGANPKSGFMNVTKGFIGQDSMSMGSLTPDSSLGISRGQTPGVKRQSTGSLPSDESINNNAPTKGMPKSKFGAIGHVSEQAEESEEESQSNAGLDKNVVPGDFSAQESKRSMNSDDQEMEKYMYGETNEDKEEFIRDPRFEWKYLAGAGQLSENQVGMETEILEQGEYLIHVQFENMPEHIKNILLIKFHFFFNVGSGTVACEKSETSTNDSFTEKVWADQAYRKGEWSQIPGNPEMEM